MTIKKEELKRKFIHLANSGIPIYYYYFIQDKMTMVWILGWLSIGFISIDYSRSRIHWIQYWFTKFFSPMLRHHELKGKLTGATWVFIGSTATVWLFDKNIAVVALLFMSIGDTFAALIGQKIGKIPIGHKTLEGFAGGFISCLVVAYFFSSLSWLIRFAGALSASLIELSPIPLDDNLKIPIVSGGIMTLLKGIGL